MNILNIYIEIGMLKIKIKPILIITLFTCYACSIMENTTKPTAPQDKAGYFYKNRNDLNMYIYDYKPIKNYNNTIFIIAGITGINHHQEKDIVELLSNRKHRVVVIHPQGTGYSDGIRGDIKRFSDFIDDYIEIIKNDKDFNSEQHKLFLFGHSMSTAVATAILDALKVVDGVILVNPPYIQKKAKGMSPTFGQYVKYAWYMIFNKHEPIVNMAGDPSKIENEQDRMESETRANDPLLVKYFSMYYMAESGKLVKSMLKQSEKAECPLLLIYGMKDPIVDKKGCDLIFEKWGNKRKKYVLVENGFHGKSTVKLAADDIHEWMRED
jgi:alpha-beta hydrolase superfamily lysophospholipase